MQLRAFSGYHHNSVVPSALQVIQDKEFLDVVKIQGI
jgi:hypothetical protein